jgi:magnesium transporter
MIHAFAYTTQGRLQSKGVEPAQMAGLLADSSIFLWVDLETATLEETKLVLEQVFHFHPLCIEDCLTVDSTPKVEEYAPGEGDQFAPYLFLVIHAVDYHRQDGQFATSELDFFLGKNFLVTYHQASLRSLATALDRAGKGTLALARSPDRVAQTLLELVVENYTPAMTDLTQDIADLEQAALRNPCQETLNKILQSKKEVLRLQQITAPQCAVVGRLAAGEFDLIQPHQVPYYRNINDALNRINSQARGFTEALTGILQVYLNMSSNQTGEVVKLLTLITVITTPLMMIGTWYGMNFKDMPELEWPHGYVIASATMLASTIGTILYFRKRKWF